MNRKLRTFLAIFLFLVSLACLVNPINTFASKNSKEWDNHKDGLSQEGLVEHQMNDVIFKSNDILLDETTTGGTTTYSGALPSLAQVVGTIYATPPASGVYYAFDVMQNLGAKTAYAQGVGFSGLQPILPVWKAFRNVTYVLFTIIFILVGVAIMFRIKISPQAVISIENAIPKVVGALILVTFSYAIAGFMIDFMYVLIALGINILKIAGVNPGLIDIFGHSIIRPGPRATINWGYYGLLPAFRPMGSTIGVFSTIFGAMLGMPVGPAGAIIGGLAGLTVGQGLIKLILSIIMIILFFKLLFGLIKAYINIIIGVILGPLQISLGAFPGIQAGGFGAWFKGLMTEIIIFPAVIMVAMIGAWLLQSPTLQQMWIAPFIGPPDLPVLSAVSGIVAANFAKMIIGIGFLLITSKLPDLIRQAMKQENILGAAAGSALGEAMGPVRTIGGFGAATGVSYGRDELNRRGGGTRQNLARRIGYRGHRNEPTGAARAVDSAVNGLIKRFTG